MAERPLLSPLGSADIAPEFNGLRKITRRFKTSGRAATAATVDADCFRTYGTADDEFTVALLVDKRLATAASEPNATDKILTEVYQEFTAGSKVAVGDDAVKKDENNRNVLTRRFVCLASEAEALAAVSGTIYGVYACNGATVAKQGVGAVITETYIEAGASFSVIGVDDIDYEINGLKRRTRTLIARAGVAFSGVIGTTTHPTDTALLLAGLSIKESAATTSVKATYLQPGIVSAEKKSDIESSLLYVTFQSFGPKVTPTCLNGASALNDDILVAFQGGAAANIFRDRSTDLQGYRTNTVTVFMKSDGAVLAANGSNVEVNSYQKFVKWQNPGILTIDTSPANPRAWGFQGYPGTERHYLCTVYEYLSTSGNVDSSFKPFSVTAWASGYLSYSFANPLYGSDVVSKAATGYIGGASGAATGSDSYAYSISSTPTTGNTINGYFYAIDRVLHSDSGPAFTSDTGVKWYKRSKVVLTGGFVA